MNLNDEILRNVLRIASQSAGFVLRVWMKCTLAAVRLLNTQRFAPVRRPTSRRTFNRRAEFVRYLARSPSEINTTALIQSP